MPYHIIEQTIDRITVHNLKHIRDLDIEFSGNRVTGILGMNGCGKSSKGSRDHDPLYHGVSACCLVDG